MGREEPSVPIGPPRISRDERAKRAKAIINKTIPAILRGNARARRGVAAAELIVDPPLPPKPAAGRGVSTRNAAQRFSNPADSSAAGYAQAPATRSEAATHNPSLGALISVCVADTLGAAQRLVHPPPVAVEGADEGGDTAGSAGGRAPHRSGPARVAILNMASPLRPGGGVLSGATSQEESLCARTTLYPSLRDEFYRLPEVGGVYTPDVLVFGRWDGELGAELDRADWFFVDVVTAAMLRLPDVDGEGEQKRYAEEKDRELAVRKMRAVMRMLKAKEVDKVVLGAWGCGAYGNPVSEIAEAWRKVLLSGPSKRKGKEVESWDGIEVVFAIKDARMAEQFARKLGVELTGAATEAPGSTDGEEGSLEE